MPPLFFGVKKPGSIYNSRPKKPALTWPYCFAILTPAWSASLYVMFILSNQSILRSCP